MIQTVRTQQNPPKESRCNTKVVILKFDRVGLLIAGALIVLPYLVINPAFTEISILATYILCQWTQLLPWPEERSRHHH